MPVRSRFLGFVRDPVTATDVVLFTVPAGRTAIVRRFSLCNRSSTQYLVSLSVRTAGVTVQTWRGAVPANGTAGDPDTNLVLGPGDDLRARVITGEASNLLDVAAFGSLLLGAPE